MNENEYLAIALNRIIGQEVNKALDRVRADIINIADGKQSIKVRNVLRNIDKHKAEIDPQESEDKNGRNEF